MAQVPLFDLYGEIHSTDLRDWLHWETIAARSRDLGFRIEAHRHAAIFQLLWLSGGGGTLHLSGQEIVLTPGDVVVVPPMVVHGYQFSDDVDGIVMSLFDHDLRAPGSVVTAAMYVPGPTAAATGLSEALIGLMRESDHLGPHHDMAMQARIALVLVAILRARAVLTGATEAVGGAAEGTQRAQALALAFKALVEQRFDKSRSLADYAARLGISPTHLGRVCRQVLGATPLSIIEARIAREARRMLVFSDHSMREIGLRLGYEDPAYFSRALSRWLGASPSAIRRGARPGPGPKPPASPA